MRRSIAVILKLGALALVVALGLGWALRLRIATALVDRTLREAEVPASYRITRIGPFAERMEDVRIGDPARPDLIARRIDLRLGYGADGPFVAHVAAEGVRLRATVDRGGLHLGALDRLLPSSTTGKTLLPDLDVAVRDARLALATPNGAIEVALDGSGNAARSFAGHARVTAGALRLASCALSGAAADLRLVTAAGAPRATGPVAIARTVCPHVTLGPGTAAIDASSSPTLNRIALRAVLDGFDGAAGPARFGGAHGVLAAAGTFGALTARISLAAAHFALPEAALAVARSASLAADTPLAAPGRQAAAAAARLLRGATLDAEFNAAILGEAVTLRLKRATVAGPDGARVTATPRGGLDWSPERWRADGDVVAEGGGLPSLTLALHQTAAGAPLSATGRVARYRAGEAAFAVPSFRVAWDGRDTRFDAIALIDGPLGGGFVQGLRLPVTGEASASGALVIGRGCQPVAFRRLRLAGFTFADTRARLCGQPILARAANGALRIDMASGPLRLAGRSDAGQPMTLDATRLRLTGDALDAAGLAVTLGETRLAVDHLAGRLSGGGAGGDFSGAAGAIAKVPLLLSDGAGHWRFAAGGLDLDGGFRLRDAAPSPRFNPLAGDGMRLRFADGRIDATATLTEPTSHTAVATVTVAHRLATTTGHALIDVPGIPFAPKRLQPEALTPLTLGVVANVAGTVSGRGRIDWTADGVTSSGSFATDALDLAAAFGPVTGIRGEVRFTDLLGLVTAPHQEATIAEINPGVAVANGVVHYQLLGAERVQVEDARWPFAAGVLRLDPTMLDFAEDAERRLTFRVDGLDAAAFVQQLEFPNIAATGTFDGTLPMIFDRQGGRIDGGFLAARKGGGTLAYVGELSSADIGTMGKLAFDALKAIRYSSLDIAFDGRLDGEMISQVRFTGIREATPEQSLVTRLIRNLPFRFNIRIRAPFRGLVGSARAYMDPRLLLNQAEPAVQTPASEAVR
ncbi:YdbH domain-containing protein [Sphingomonas quercus]|uniref:YdbH domain-containing protein n=1 Tax=Sphingomonas quercus TaxID=2842451 RepID=A0ABS6BJR7_9SPHN|nr:YdbH domain-containing protein [Sphingomonas quercus]MBU3078540.1 YdbH domain-containing protein [Sphingomonas quercus]